MTAFILAGAVLFCAGLLLGRAFARPVPWYDPDAADLDGRGLRYQLPSADDQPRDAAWFSTEDSDEELLVDRKIFQNHD